MIVHSARILSGGTIVPDGWLHVEGGRVSARGTGDAWRNVAGEVVVDAGGRLLVPGFVDLHCHGGGGFAFDDGAEAARAALAVHRAHGTTRSVLSLVTARIDELLARVRALVPLVRDDPSVLGLHLEGPFLADSHRGAHDPSLLRTPDAGTVDALIEAADGCLFQVTMAPELPGSDDAIRRFVSAGVRVAVGHTGADFDTALRAFDAGATILTHAFNGMPGIHHRAPGPVLAAIRSEHVIIEVIADGVHVDPEVIGLLFRAAPGRVALVTDAMAATGAPDGPYQLGPLPVTVSGGIARTASGGLAGSTLTQDRALRVAVHQARVPLAEAVAALTTTPAGCFAPDDVLGRLEPGSPADAVLLEDDLSVARVWAQESDREPTRPERHPSDVR